MKWPVAVEKLHFRQNNRNLGDRKCLGKSRTLLTGHPDAILFLRISREGVFQQPRLLSTVILSNVMNGQPFTPKAGRDAFATIAGFVYQVDVTVLAWLNLEDSDSWSLNGAKT